MWAQQYYFHNKGLLHFSKKKKLNFVNLIFKYIHRKSRRPPVEAAWRLLSRCPLNRLTANHSTGPAAGSIQV